MLIRDTEATTLIKLVIEGLNSKALFPPEKCLSIVLDHFGYTKNDQGVNELLP